MAGRAPDDRHPAVTAVCGLPLLAASAGRVQQWLIGRIVAGQGGWILTLNLEMLAQMHFDRNYRALLGGVDYATADGMPLVWASAWARGPRVEGRTTGIELCRAILEAPEVARVALVGGLDPQAVARRFCPSPARSYVVRGEALAFSEAVAERLAAELKAKNAQVALLALGVPKQDFFAAYLRRHVPGLTVVGVGGSFEALLGLRRETPVWMQKAGLEWLFRLLCEPRRLWRRYLLRYPFGMLFLLRWLATDGRRCCGGRS